MKLSTVAIGKPISNTQIYILGKHLQLVPIGVAGEIYIGGDGLARGYLNRPELTKEKFIANPFDTGRLYQTGDLARYLPDGNIEYLGRIDNQVKLRGFRIELGEIEASLMNHPQIRQAVVIASEELSANKRLVAYVVSESGSETSNISTLRQYLLSKLPEYMVPSAFVSLEDLPLTPNGKVDRKALPAPDGHTEREVEYVAPSTKIEKSLSEIWQEILLVEKVSIHDNFFELGGDSILSIQVIAHARNEGISITAKQIFQHQTISELAEVANTTANIIAQQGIVTGVASLTPIQNWFFEQNHLDVNHYNQSVLLKVPGTIEVESLKQAVAKLIEHHDALRLRFNSKLEQINEGLNDVIPFSVVDLSSTTKENQIETLEKMATEFQSSLNLSSGPIIQVVMFDLGRENNKRLLIVVHHLVVDGVSWRILLSDLNTIYQQLINQQPLQLSAKTTAFIDWANKLSNYVQSDSIQEELEYWLSQSWSESISIPTDKTDIQKNNTVDSAGAVSVKLGIEETQALVGNIHTAYNTQINDLLLSALTLTLTKWTRKSQVSINLEGHGREEIFDDVDLSRTVGWFTSIFPVLLGLPEEEGKEPLIKLTKEKLRAIPNRGVGYGILRYLCKDNSVNQQLEKIVTPEISFNYFGQFDQIQSDSEWKFASESTGASRSSEHNREYLLDINALVVEGELQVTWTYSSNVHSRVTVEKLAQSYLEEVNSIIEHCQSETAWGYTPSDFPEASLTQLELDDLFNS